MAEGDTEAGRQVALGGRHTLEIRREDGTDLVTLLAPDGRACLSIEVGEGGPVLRLEGAATLRLGGALRVDAERLELHGRSGVALTSGGAMEVSAEGDLVTQGLRQRITSSRGDVQVEANDDLRLDGERVLVNC